MQRRLFHKTYSASMSSLKLSRTDIKSVAEKLQWEPQVINPLLLCTSELIANTVNYSQQPKATTFSVSLSHSQTELVLEYRDNGEAYNPFSDSIKPLDAISTLAENGRGLSLLKATSQSLRYKRNAKPYVNCIECYYPWARQQNKQRILLVEDDPAQNLLFSEYLSEKYHVVRAHFAKEAFEILSHQAVDLVVSDISMPDTNGIELRKRLLEQSDTELIPFMFLTGTEDLSGSEGLAHLGIDDFLQKPVSKQKLLASVDRVLGRMQQLVIRLSEKLDNRITQALYPKLPQHCLGWHIASDRRDTGSGGGDAVFLEATPDPTIVLLDVMGHDITAKFFAHAHTGYLRGLVKSMTPTSEQHARFCPARLLSQFSDVVYADELLNHTILTTLIIKLLPSGNIQYASAGHPPPILITRTGIKVLDQGGMIAGMTEHCSYINMDYQLQPGERLLVYSDGLFEGADSAKGRDQLEKSIYRALEQSADLELEDAKKKIMSTFDFCAGRASDDVTFILLEAENYTATQE